MFNKVIYKNALPVMTMTFEVSVRTDGKTFRAYSVRPGTEFRLCLGERATKEEAQELAMLEEMRLQDIHNASVF